MFKSSFEIKELTSFRKIIKKCFEFRHMKSNDVSVYDVKKLQILDIMGINTMELDVSYSYRGSYNEIVLSNSETGEILCEIKQEPCLLPNSSRWMYEITYCDWGFNPTFEIECGFAILFW